MQANNQNVGISGLAAYMPPLRIQLQDWCDWTGTPWGKIRKVIGHSFRMRAPNQSVYTMAATAVIRLIDQYDIDPRNIGFLGFGTESSTDNSAGPIIIKGMLDEALEARGMPRVARGCEVPEFKHACLGGVYAMKGALRYLALDGRGKQAIVVCADIAEYARGSTGEPTQGAGAVAMLIEENPKLVEVPLELAGSASEYRKMDFRKPMLRYCGQDTSETIHIQDFPVFNGKFSTTCYIDETLHALNDMYEKRGIDGISYLRSLNYIFMHRPYRRMPETGLAFAYLAALAHGDETALAELDDYAREAGVETDGLVAELRGERRIDRLANERDVSTEAFPLTMAVMYAFRASPAYATEITGKLALGGESNCDFGNLYTAALPAWLAAGLEVALADGIELAGEELLTMGYGSGDAAEVIPFNVVEGWQEAAARIGFESAMANPVDLTQAQYEALHDGRRVDGLSYALADEFFVERVGTSDERHFQDTGIEYYGWAADARHSA